MVNYYDYVRSLPELYKQFPCRDLLFQLGECSPDFERAEYWSEQNAFIYVQSGRLILSNRKESWHLQKGDLVFLKKGCFGVEKTDYDTFCSLLIHVPDRFIRNFMRQHTDVFSTVALPIASGDMVLPMAHAHQVKSLNDLITPILLSGSEPTEEPVESAFRDFLFEALTHTSNGDLKAYFHKVAFSKVNELKEVMERTCLFDLDFPGYARLCHRSLSAFKRDFLQLFSVQPGKWLTEKRLEGAHHLLLTTDKPILNIAMECGFGNYTHFSRVFKNFFGISPLQCREQRISMTAHFS